MKKNISILLIFAIIFSCSNDPETIFVDTDSNQKQTARSFGSSILSCGTQGIPQALPLNDKGILDFIQHHGAGSPAYWIKQIEVKFHVVTKNDGTGGVPESEIDLLFTTLVDTFGNFDQYLVNPNYPYPFDPNLDPTPYGHFEFVKLATNQISNSDLHKLTTQAEIDSLFQIDRAPNVLNIYLVAELRLGTQYYEGLAEGYFTNASILSTRNDFHINNPTLIAHEAGHNFGLRHTFYYNFGLCLSDNNSSFVGDMIGDTPTDITSAASESFNNACEYTGNRECMDGGLLLNIPAWQAEFLSKNAMGYIYDCHEGFTILQMIQMMETVNNSDIFGAN